MLASGSAWFCLVVGVALLVEVASSSVLRGRSGSRRSQSPMLASMGVMLISGSVSRLVALSGAWMTVAFLVGVAGSIATVVFAIRSWDARRAAVPPSRD